MQNTGLKLLLDAGEFFSPGSNLLLNFERELNMQYGDSFLFGAGESISSLTVSFIGSSDSSVFSSSSSSSSFCSQDGLGFSLGFSRFFSSSTPNSVGLCAVALLKNL